MAVIASGTVTQNDYNALSAGRLLMAMPFTAGLTANIGTVVYNEIWKRNSPVDECTSFIYTDVAGSPGVSMGQGPNFTPTPTAQGSGVNTTVDMTAVVIPVVNTVSYWLVYGRTGSVDGTNGWAWDSDSASSDLSKGFDGANWNAFNAQSGFTINSADAAPTVIYRSLLGVGK